MFHLFLILLNYFWLSDDPEESASWYCDQHCFKIGSEVIESVWDAVIVLAPCLQEEADKEGISQNNRKRRHSKKDGLWHPMSVWNGFCRSNMRRSLINADAIFKEHEKRTGKRHSAWEDCKFLTKHVNFIDFNSKIWHRWFSSQNGSTDTKYTPTKTKKADLDRRKILCEKMGLIDDDRNRNTCKMTMPGQYINEKIFANCKVDGNHIQAYRNYYNAKINTVGGGMRYFYSDPPPWILKKYKLVTKRKTKVPKKKNEYLLDSEGYVVVVFVDKL